MKYYILLFIMMMKAECFAYTFTSDFKSGIFWGAYPLSVRAVVAKGENIELLTTLINESIQSWESILGKEIWAFSDNGQNSSANIVRWSNNFQEETGFDATKTLAVTIRYNSGQLFDHFEIILNANIDYLKNNGGGMLKNTLIHELGHTIGLDHSEVDAIMYPYISTFSQLTEDDDSGANAVISETLNRQSKGIVATLDSEEQYKNGASVIGCGTISLNSDGSNGPGGSSTSSPLFSMFIGLVGYCYFSKLLKGKKLPQMS